MLVWTAFGLSAYLTFASLSHAKVVGCAAGETVDCDSVLSSQWSTWLGLPVALGGLACYATLASLSVLLGVRGAAARRWIGSLVVLLSVVAGGAALWFIALQLLVIHKICVLCMYVHACGVLIAALVVWAMVIRPTMIGRSLSKQAVDRQILVVQSARGGLPTPSLSGSPSIGLALGGAMAVLMLLVGGQVLFPPETFTTVSSVALAQTIELNATDKPATKTRPAADERDAPESSARGGMEPTRPAPATRPVRATSPADDLFAELDQPSGQDDAADDLFAAETNEAPDDLVAAEADQPTSDDDARGLFAAGGRAADIDDAENLFATATDEPPPNTMVTKDDGAVADRPAVEPDRLEPVMPVSAAGGRQGASTADWRSMAANPPAAPAKQQERMVSLLGGRLKLDMYKNPVLGPMDAPHVIVELMSYHCPHCRRMHEMIQQGLKRYDGQLAVVEMVVPLEMGCNKYITSSKYSHPGSCTLTRLSLGVATVDRAAFPAFHDWLLADSAKPPSPERATTHAFEIVDRDRLREVMQSDELKNQVEGYVELFTILRDLSEKQHKAFGLPVQIVGQTIISGDVTNAGQLYWTWEKNLGLRPHTAAPANRTGSNP